MSSISFTEFQVKRDLLEGSPLKDKKDLLFEVGQYFQETIGSEIDKRYVLEIEQFLNGLYLKAVQELAQYEIQEMLIDAGGLASALSHAIKNNAIDNDFFARAKRLGLALTNMS